MNAVIVQTGRADRAVTPLRLQPDKQVYRVDVFRPQFENIVIMNEIQDFGRRLPENTEVRF